MAPQPIDPSDPSDPSAMLATLVRLFQRHVELMEQLVAAMTAGPAEAPRRGPGRPRKNPVDGPQSQPLPLSMEEPRPAQGDFPSARLAATTAALAPTPAQSVAAIAENASVLNVALGGPPLRPIIPPVDPLAQQRLAQTMGPIRDTAVPSPAVMTYDEFRTEFLAWIGAGSPGSHTRAQELLASYRARYPTPYIESFRNLPAEARSLFLAELKSTSTLPPGG
jgi:hypothetical protein